MQRLRGSSAAGEPHRRMLQRLRYAGIAALLRARTVVLHVRVLALGMSYYSASMSWDHTRLTSSKVVAHNTCSTGTATDRSGVYRYHYR